MERRSKRLLRWVLLSALVVALWLGGRFLLSAIDTFGDMEARLDELSLPGDGFAWIDQDRHGMRLRFAGASVPQLSRAYAVAWDDALCQRIADWMRPFGRIEELPQPPLPTTAPSTPTGRLLGRGLARPQVGCQYLTRIEAGLSAKLVNVWDYGLRVTVTPPTEIIERQEVRDCREHRERTSQFEGFQLRYAPCWVPRGEAMVEIALTGKTGF